jgi:aryl-alcohol dehydrogenase-like predicted oxidoreductase
MSATYGNVPHFERPISRLVLGSIALTSERLDEGFALMDAYVGLGGNAIDTAHIYGPSRHDAVGKYLAARGRDTLIVMDKGCHPMGRNRVTRADMFSDVDESLKRMGIEHLDFFVLHRDDPSVPAEEVIEWLNELKQLGKVRAFGGSNWHHSRLLSANVHAEKLGLQPFSLSSPNLALALPQAEMWSGVYWLDREARDWFEVSKMPVFSWSSGASGFFAGVESDDVKRVYFNEANFGRKKRAEEVGEKYGLSATQVALAWTLNQPLNAFAIMGPRTPAEAEENMKVAEVKLSPEELAYLELGD